MGRFEVGDRIVKVGKNPDRKGVIVHESLYFDRRGHGISSTSYCVIFNDSEIIMVIPQEDLEFDIQWYREQRLKGFLD